MDLRSPLADLLDMPVDQARLELERALAIVEPACRLADSTDLDAVREDIDDTHVEGERV